MAAQIMALLYGLMSHDLLANISQPNFLLL
jgi:hypothetical protein